MLSGWRTVFEISSRRQNTRRGHGHLSDHALAVLAEQTMNEEAYMRAIMIRGQLGLLRRG